MQYFDGTLPRRKRGPQHDQDVLNEILKARETDIIHKALPTFLFPSGYVFFKILSSEERARVAVVHNNFIIGHQNKKNRFKSYGLWTLDRQDFICPRETAS